MTDARLRALERRWIATASAEDEASYLLERMRLGELSREALELAAFCGHEGARQACPEAPVGSARDLLHGLRRWGKEPIVVAAASAALGVAGFWRDVLPAHDALAGEAALAAAEAWIACPCLAHAQEARRAGEQAERVESLWDPAAPQSALEAITGAAEAALTIVASDVGWESEIDGAAWRASAALACSAECTSDAEVQAEVRRAVAAWALG